MTTPDLSSLIPSKYKAVVGLIGSALSFAVPYILEVTNGLSAPWPVVVGVVLFILTALGIYKAPYVPPGAVVAPDTAAVAQAATQATPPREDIDDVPPPTPGLGGYRNPWQ